MKNRKLGTPMGDISVLVDGSEIEYFPIKCENDKVLCPDALGRYLIKIQFIPDGVPHEIACSLSCGENVSVYPESGEDLECLAFYDEDSFKLSMGTHAEEGRDYGVEYLRSGMQYLVLPKTKTEEYEFGVCWIDNVGLDERGETENDRDTQTWFGADPSMF